MKFTIDIIIIKDCVKKKLEIIIEEVKQKKNLKFIPSALKHLEKEERYEVLYITLRTFLKLSKVRIQFRNIKGNQSSSFPILVSYIDFGLLVAMDEVYLCYNADILAVVIYRRNVKVCSMYYLHVYNCHKASLKQIYIYYNSRAGQERENNRRAKIKEPRK